RMVTHIPDDATAEKIVKGFSPEAKVLMVGWEHDWGIEQTFAFPRVILEGKIEDLPEEARRKACSTRCPSSLRRPSATSTGGSRPSANTTGSGTCRSFTPSRSTFRR